MANVVNGGAAMETGVALPPPVDPEAPPSPGSPEMTPEQVGALVDSWMDLVQES